MNELENLMEQAKKGLLTRDQLMPEEAQQIIEIFGAVKHAYITQFIQQRKLNWEDTNTVLEFGLYELETKNHPLKNIVKPEMLLMYQELHQNKPY